MRDRAKRASSCQQVHLLALRGPAGSTHRGSLMKTVIVVDDERATARVHADLLEVLGYSTIDFRSPAECIAWLGANRADIGLFDLCMPGIDGVELIECFHRLVQRFPVGLLTGDRV